MRIKYQNTKSPPSILMLLLSYPSVITSSFYVHVNITKQCFGLTNHHQGSILLFIIWSQKYFWRAHFHFAFNVIAFHFVLSRHYFFFICYIDLDQAIGLISRVFANGPGDQVSIPGWVIPKTQKMVLDTVLLNTQHYKVRIKGKVEQSREGSSTHPYASVQQLLKKEPSGHPRLRSPTI